MTRPSELSNWPLRLIPNAPGFSSISPGPTQRVEIKSRHYGPCRPRWIRALQIQWRSRERKHLIRFAMRRNTCKSFRPCEAKVEHLRVEDILKRSLQTYRSTFS